MDGGDQGGDILGLMLAIGVQGDGKVPSLALGIAKADLHGAPGAKMQREGKNDGRHRPSIVLTSVIDDDDGGRSQYRRASVMTWPMLPASSRAGMSIKAVLHGAG